MKEFPPPIEWKQRGDRPGTLPPIHNPPGKKRKVMNYVLGRRCQYCLGPIIGVLRWRGGWVPIEPGSWDGSAYYIRGVHKFHGRKCEFWRKRPRFVKRDPDSDI